MFKTIGISVVVLFLSVLQLQGQSSGFVYYDSLTYHQYINKDYGALLKTGRKALQEGLDYYYLRMRMGIAAYQQKKYRLAALHFEKALQFNDNSLVREYLYYSYLWGGYPLLARETEKDMPEVLKKKLKISGKKILSTEAVLAYLTRMDNIPGDFSIPKENGYQVIPKQFYDASVSLSHRLGNRGQMTHMVTFINKQNEKYYYENNEVFYEPSFSTNQFQYYLGTKFSPGQRWSIYFDGQVSFLSQPVYVESGGGMGRNTYRETTVWQTDFVFSAAVERAFTRFSLTAEMAYVNIGQQPAWQPSALLRIYPFANLDLYTESRFSYLYRNNTGTFFQQQKAGWKLLKKLWMEASYFSGLPGGVSGFVMDNSSLLFNGPEEISRMAGVRVLFLARQNTRLSAGYQYRKQAVYFVPAADPLMKTNKLDLNYSLFYILVSWSF